MQEVQVVHWCDHPVCIENRSELVGGQEVKEVQIWFYTRGQKRKPIRVELCQEHEEELRTLYQALNKFNMEDS